MAAKKKAKRFTRDCAQDRARVARGQDYEVAYQAKKTDPRSVMKDHAPAGGTLTFAAF
jgi:hypothetical protein